jgi:hypothetical protein
VILLHFIFFEIMVVINPQPHRSSLREVKFYFHRKEVIVTHLREVILPYSLLREIILLSFRGGNPTLFIILLISSTGGNTHSFKGRL